MCVIELGELVTGKIFIEKRVQTARVPSSSLVNHIPGDRAAATSFTQLKCQFSADRIRLICEVGIGGSTSEFGVRPHYSPRADSISFIIIA